MDQCRYCRKEVSPGAKACEDCKDYVTAARVASRVVQDSEIENGFVAAAVGAEIVREFLSRSVGSARARHPHPPTDDQLTRGERPLL
ncbi:MAG: hypothetical protein AVDCRST_MAG15-1013 [uncultured Rubellimicrobium sp.]|uniref:Uncharacterized protein n=1 Tax=uncultured Rubellimicrobium sp. TaxID=543078 RepID=A0A6J4NCD2_9RHOB|nr:MAG: hypothetical protein AVDCRST_MAG15-1013 [uncultured Rubellimicrobium sp.]